MAKRPSVKPASTATRTRRPATRRAAPARALKLTGTWVLTYNQILGRVAPGAEAAFLNDGAWIGAPLDALHKHECRFVRDSSGEWVATPTPLVGYPGGPSSEAALGTLRVRVITRETVRTAGKPPAAFSSITMFQETPAYCSAWAGSRVYKQGKRTDVPQMEFRGYWRDFWHGSDVHRAGYFKLTKRR